MTSVRDWLLIFVDPTASNPSTYQIVAEGNVPRTRPVKNAFRGAALKTVVTLIHQCENQKESVSTEDIPKGAYEALGESARAYPIFDADSTHVVAVHFWSGSTSDAVPKRPPIGTWEWHADAHADDPAPPQLYMNSVTLDLIGMEKEHRDRTVFGPADLYTRSARLSDSIHHLRKLRDLPQTMTAKASPIERSNLIISRGEVSHQLHYCERAVSDRRIQGVCWIENTPRQVVRESMLDSWLCNVLAAASDMYVAVGDTSYKYPYFVKWVTEHLPGLGHGVSTGGTFALHEDDFPKIVRWISDLDAGKKVSGEVRARRGGGGYLSAKFTALPLDPDVNPKLVLVLIQPHSTAVEDKE